MNTCHIFEESIRAFQLLKEDWHKSVTKSCDLHGFCVGIDIFFNESLLNCIQLQPSINI